MVLKMLSRRDLQEPERRSVSIVANAMGNGDLQLYQSDSNGKDTDPKKCRSSLTILGAFMEKRSPPGFVAAPTPVGKRVYDGLRDQLETVAESESAAAKRRVFYSRLEGPASWRRWRQCHHGRAHGPVES